MFAPSPLRYDLVAAFNRILISQKPRLIDLQRICRVKIRRTYSLFH